MTIKTIKKNALKELTDFKFEELTKEKAEIYADSKKIQFFEAICNYLTALSYENVLLSEDVLTHIEMKGTHFISELYKFCSNNNDIALTDYEGITDTISFYCNSR